MKRRTNPDKHEKMRVFHLTPEETFKALSRGATIEVRPGLWMQLMITMDRKRPLKGGPRGHLKANWMGCLLREGNGVWEFRTRLSYEMDNDPLARNDHKVRKDYHFPADWTAEQAMEACRKIVAVFRPAFQEYHDNVLGFDGGEKGAFEKFVESNPMFSTHLMPDPSKS